MRSWTEYQQLNKLLDFCFYGTDTVHRDDVHFCGEIAILNIFIIAWAVVVVRKRTQATKVYL